MNFEEALVHELRTIPALASTWISTVATWNTAERTWVVRLGEDAMIGSYIISKLGRPGLSVDLEKRINKKF